MDQAPTALVADDEAVNRLFAARVLVTNGWRVVEAGDGHEAVSAAIREMPSLILMDLMMPGQDGIAATLAIRASRGPVSGVPILAYTTHRVAPAMLRAGGLDGSVIKPCTAEEMAEAVNRWRPDGEVQALTRLGAVFGAKEITRMANDFRVQLIAAVDGMEKPGHVDRAHRIAGVAGTLGFDAVSKSWLALSEGDGSAAAEARRVARVAIASIARRDVASG